MVWLYKLQILLMNNITWLNGEEAGLPRVDSTAETWNVGVG